MKNWLLGALVVALATSAPMMSEAKRLGGGKSQGMQRSAPAQPAPQRNCARATQCAVLDPRGRVLFVALAAQLLFSSRATANMGR